MNDKKKSTSPKGWKTLSIRISPEDYDKLMKLLMIADNGKPMKFTAAFRKVFKLPLKDK